MFRKQPESPITPLHRLNHGQAGDFFTVLAEKVRATTRDGKPYYSCRFRDARRSTSAKIWNDSPHFDECDKQWTPGVFYKVRALFTDHERFGPQIEIFQIREVRPDDREEGFREADMFDRSRYPSDAMLADLRKLVETEIVDEPLKRLVLAILDRNTVALTLLPASRRKYYPFPGGWLEHALQVTRTCVWLADKYGSHYQELSPKLNRDLITAGAVLHDIGRLAELSAGEPGQPAALTVNGRLLGHLQLGRDIVRESARDIPELNPELLALLEHLILTHSATPEWGTSRQSAIPEALIVHHAAELDAMLEMSVRLLEHDENEGPFTEHDSILKRQLLKSRTV